MSWQKYWNYFPRTIIHFKNIGNPWLSRYGFALLLLLPITIGIFLRIRLFTRANPLLLDEVLLILNITSRNYQEVLRPLDYNQAAPLGYLWLLRWLSQIVGTNLSWLRIVSVSSSILALILFPFVTIKIISKRATLLATIMLAFTVSLLFHTPVVKQYSGDVLAAVVGLYLIFSLFQHELNLKKSMLFGFAGALLILFSHPAIFVLAGGGIIIFLREILLNNKNKTLYLTLAGSIWVLFFLATVFISLPSLSKNEALLYFWSEAGSFPPSLTNPLLLAGWVKDKFLLLFRWEPLYFVFDGLAIMFFIVGSASFTKRDKWLIFILLLPFFLMLLASSLKYYPFFDRLTLFTVPLLVIILGEGMDRFISMSEKGLLKVAAILIISLLLFPLFIQALNYQKGGDWDKDILPAMEYIQDYWAEGDLFVYSRQMPYGPVFLYLTRYPFPEKRMITLFGVEPYRDDYSAEIERLVQDYKRIWLFFSVVAEEDKNNDVQDIIGKFGALSNSEKVIDLVQSNEYLYLFENSRPDFAE